MDELKTFLEAFKNLLDIPDEQLTDDMLNTILTNVDENFSPAVTMQSMNQIIKNLEDQNLTKAEAITSVNALKETLKEMVYGEEQFVGNK